VCDSRNSIFLAAAAVVFGGWVEEMGVVKISESDSESGSRTSLLPILVVISSLVDELRGIVTVRKG